MANGGIEMIDLLMIVLKGTLLLVLAIALAAALRRAPAGSRHLVWLTTLATVVLFPLLAQWEPLRMEVLPPLSPRFDVSAIAQSETPTPALAPAPQTSGRDAPRVTADPRASASATPTRDANAQWRAPSIGTLVLYAWLAGTAALLGWLALGMLAVRRILGTGHDLTDEKWTTPLYEVADRMNLETVPRLVSSTRVEMPFACGILHPTIVFPASADAWTDDRRRVVLFHELAHIQRRDLIGHALGRLACALYWFHPLVWTAARQLRAESERACDDLVLACGARASDYVAHLLDIVTGVRRSGAPVTALPMARKREFEGRMLAILDPGIPRGAPGRLQSVGILVTVVAITLSVAAAAPASPPSSGQQLVVAADTIDSDSLRKDAPDVSGPAAIALEKPPAGPASPERRLAQDTPAVRAPVAAPTPVPVPLHEHEVESISEEMEQRARAKKGRVLTPEETKLQSDRIEKLAKILATDTDPEVRIAAAWALSRVRDARAASGLRDALRKDKHGEVREMAAWALVQTGSASTSMLVDALREDANEDVRETAAWGLGQIGADEATPALTAAIRDESAEVRRTAIWALGTMRSREPATAIADALDDESDEVRLQAAWALGQLSSPNTASALRTAFTAEKDDEVRRAIFRALAILGDTSDEFINEAMKSPDPELRSRAVRALAGHGAGGWPWPWPWPRPRPSP